MSKRTISCFICSVFFLRQKLAIKTAAKAIQNAAVAIDAIPRLLCQLYNRILRFTIRDARDANSDAAEEISFRLPVTESAGIAYHQHPLCVQSGVWQF